MEISVGVSVGMAVTVVVSTCVGVSVGISVGVSVAWAWTRLKVKKAANKNTLKGIFLIFFIRFV